MKIKTITDFIKYLFSKPFKELLKAFNKPTFLLGLILFLMLVDLIRGVKIKFGMIILFVLSMVWYQWSVYYGDWKHKEKQQIIHIPTKDKSEDEIDLEDKKNDEFTIGDLIKNKK